MDGSPLGVAKPQELTVLPAPRCPSWCASDLPTDGGGVIHLSTAAMVPTDAGGPTERGFATVSVERFDGVAGPDSAAAIRVEADGLMTPLTALLLADSLRAAVIAAGFSR
jgi:hypothetical protein